MTESLKTKSLLNIEKQMSSLDPHDMRYKVLEAARNFKSSWFELGRYLYTVYKDKLYRQWGFVAFETYCVKEIGIRSQTAVKLLKSYYFIEKDEPDLNEAVPNFESVNVLRLAKNNPNVDEEGYKKLKNDVFQEQRDFSEVGKQFRSMIKLAKEQSDPEREHRREFQSKIRRIISSLKLIKHETDIKNILPEKILNQLDSLIGALEEKLEEK